jgi:hypothetical protein
MGDAADLDFGPFGSADSIMPTAGVNLAVFSKGRDMVSMTDAKSQQVGKWAIIVGALVLIGAIAFALKSTSSESSNSAAAESGPAQ